MNNFIRFFIAVIISLSFASCVSTTTEKKEEDIKYKNYLIEVVYIDGFKDTIEKRLPIKSELYISSYRGNYDLAHTGSYYRTVEPAVIRFKVLN